MSRPAIAERRAATRIRTVARIPVVLDDDRTVEARFVTFDNLRDGREHFALQFGRPAGDAPFVRLHSECITGDVFGSTRCDCGPQLREAMRRLHDEGGYLLYLRQEGRGIGLFAKLDAYRLQEQGLDTYEANRRLGFRDDLRDYEVAADILRALEIDRITLLSNNPEKRRQLESGGIAVDGQVPTGIFAGPDNRRYLEAKVRHTGHLIDLDGTSSGQALRISPSDLS